MITRGRKVDYYKPLPRYRYVVSKRKQRLGSTKTSSIRLTRASPRDTNGTHSRVTRRKQLALATLSSSDLSTETTVLSIDESPIAIRKANRLDTMPFEISRKVYTHLLDAKENRERHKSEFSDDFWSFQMQRTHCFETAILYANRAIYLAAKKVLYQDNLLVLVTFDHPDPTWLWFAKQLKQVRFNKVPDNESLPPCPVHVDHSLGATGPVFKNRKRISIVVAARNFRGLCRNLCESHERRSSGLDEWYSVKALPWNEVAQKKLGSLIWQPLTQLRKTGFAQVTVTDCTGVLEKSDGEATPNLDPDEEEPGSDDEGILGKKDNNDDAVSDDHQTDDCSDIGCHPTWEQDTDAHGNQFPADEYNEYGYNCTKDDSDSSESEVASNGLESDDENLDDGSSISFST